MRASVKEDVAETVDTAYMHEIDMQVEVSSICSLNGYPHSQTRVELSMIFSLGPLPLIQQGDLSST